jgi:hypothetical protein
VQGPQGDTGVAGTAGLSGNDAYGTLVGGVQQLRARPRYTGPGIMGSTSTSFIDYPIAATRVSKLFVKAYVETSATITVMRNGRATALSCKLDASKSCSNVFDEVLFNDGDTVAFRVTPKGTASGARVVLSVRTAAPVD